MSRKSGSMLTLVVLLVITFIFAMFQGGFVSWFLFFSLLTLTVITCLWYAVWFKGLKVERTVSKKQAVAGDTLKVTVTLNNSRPWIPYAYLWIEDLVEDKRLRNESQAMLVYPWFKRKLVLEYELPQLTRGVFRFKQLNLGTGDLFGFAYKSKTYHMREQVLVYPKYKEISSWVIDIGKKQGRLAKQLNWQEDAFVSGIRNYTPGDRLTHIHWKASARFQSLKTKEFEQHLSTDLIFFLDRETKVYPADDDSLFELGVTLTASLVHYCLTHAVISKIISHGDQGLEELSLPQRNDSFVRALEYLTYVEADSRLPFSKVLLEQSSFSPRGSTQVIISPQLSKELILLLAELNHRQKNIHFFWLKGKNVLPEEQFLAKLQKAQINFYIIEDNEFHEILARGGGNRYVSPAG